jgi:hypothetical protein
MTTHQDPVVRDITQYINRSAGQHQRRISEGTESARRLIDLKVVDTMTDDPLNLHRPVSEQAQEDAEQMEAIRKWRESQQAIEFAGEEPFTVPTLVLAAFAAGAFFLLVWHLSPELRALVSIIKN